MGMLPSLCLAFFCSPLYFFIKKRWIAAIIHSILYVIALCTIWFFIGIIPWLISFYHAFYCIIHEYRLSMMKKQAEMIAEAQHEYKSDEKVPS